MADSPKETETIGKKTEKRGSNPNSVKNLKRTAGPGRPKITEEERNIKDICREHTELAVNTLIEVAKRGTSDGARVAAASTILDRGWDKPKQGVAHTGEISVFYQPAPVYDVPLPDHIRDRLIGTN